MTDAFGTPLTADQEFQAGFTCNGARATPNIPLPFTCLASQFGSSLISVPAPGAENDDHNPPRIAPRNLFDVAIVAAFGVIGAILLALEFPLSPIVLGFVLGPMLEPNFRRAMLLSRGDLSVFVARPVAAGFVAASALLVMVQVVAWWRGRRRLGASTASR